MNIKVRFTAPEDLDLIALVHSGVRMGLVIRDVLRAYVRQEIFYVPMPNTIKCINTENTSVNFILNSEKDGDVIAFLRSIRNGYKKHFTFLFYCSYYGTFEKRCFSHSGQSLLAG